MHESYRNCPAAVVGCLLPSRHTYNRHQAYVSYYQHNHRLFASPYIYHVDMLLYSSTTREGGMVSAIIYQHACAKKKACFLTSTSVRARSSNSCQAQVCNIGTYISTSKFSTSCTAVLRSIVYMILAALLLSVYPFASPPPREDPYE